MSSLFLWRKYMVAAILLGVAMMVVIAFVVFLICSGFSVVTDDKAIEWIGIPIVLVGIVVFLLVAYTLGLGTKQVVTNFRAWCAEGAQEQQK